MPFAQGSFVPLFVAALAFVIVWVCIAILVARNGRVWVRACVSGVPISFFEIIGMRLRRTDVDAVLRALIMAKQGGVTISCRDAAIWNVPT